MKTGLTKKQQLIYDYICSFTDEHGYPPSVREIGEAVDLKSPSTVHFHLKGLEEAGMIVKSAGKTRAISLPNREVSEPVASAEQNMVPIVGNVAAGSPILAEECIEDYLCFDTDGAADEHFALRVRGESMIRIGIMPGDLVVVHQQESFRNGDIVVALFEDEATVKTLHRVNGTTWLLPENDDTETYQPIDGTYAELIGKVVAVVRRY